MSEPVLLIEKSEGIATLMMNRPHVLNALSSELLFTLKDAFEELKRDSEIEVVILGGIGRAFTVGLDFKELAAMNGPFSESRLSQATFECFPTIESFDKPIIGAVNGAAITGGFEIALNCDMILATESAGFADTHVRVGIIPGAGLSQKLSRIVGINRARELSLTGKAINARQAEAWGLVNRIVGEDNLIPACRTLAKEITANDKTMVRNYHKLLNDGYRENLSQGLLLEKEVHRQTSRATATQVDANRLKQVKNRGRIQEAASQSL